MIREPIKSVIFVLGILFFFTCGVGYAKQVKTLPGLSHQSIEAGGLPRSYDLYVPNIAKGKTDLPLIVAFHGGGNNAGIMRKTTDLVALSDKEGFAIAFPNGTGRLANLLTWNVGKCCAYAKRNNVDDIGFVRAMLDDIQSKLSVDKKRIFATGISNGAMMAHRVGCELSDRIAAIAPVAGGIEVASCTPARAVPVMHIHGTEDPFVRFEGGVGSRSITKTDFRPVDRTMDIWRGNNSCSARFKTKDLPDKENDGTTTQMKIWNDCPQKTDVILVTIKGGGHSWPGSDAMEKLPHLGRSSRDFSASALMWRFFQDHPMP